MAVSHVCCAWNCEARCIVSATKSQKCLKHNNQSKLIQNTSNYVRLQGDKSKINSMATHMHLAQLHVQMLCAEICRFRDGHEQCVHFQFLCCSNIHMFKPCFTLILDFDVYCGFSASFLLQFLPFHSESYRLSFTFSIASSCIRNCRKL